MPGLVSGIQAFCRQGKPWMAWSSSRGCIQSNVDLCRSHASARRVSVPGSTPSSRVARPGARLKSSHAESVSRGDAGFSKRSQASGNLVREAASQRQRALRMSSLNETKERSVAQCVGDPPVSMAVASTAFPVQRNPRTPTRTSELETPSVNCSSAHRPSASRRRQPSSHRTERRSRSICCRGPASRR